MQEIYQNGQVLGSRCYQPGRDSRMSGTRRQDGNSTARKSQRKLNKSKAKVRCHISDSGLFKLLYEIYSRLIGAKRESIRLIFAVIV